MACDILSSTDSIDFLDYHNLNGINLYVYCSNNPVMYFDENGNMPEWANWLIGVGIISALALATIVTAGIAGVGLGTAFAAGFAGSAIGTGASGIAATMATSAFAGATIWGFTSALASGVMTAVSGGNISDIIESSSASFMFGAGGRSNIWNC